MNIKNTIINISISSQDTSIDARELHKALDVKKDFTSWIKTHLRFFVENQDFVIFTQKGEKSVRGRPTSQYAVTLEMAKHIALMSRTAKGHQVRQAYIDLESDIKINTKLPDFNNPIEAARAWADSEESRLRLESQIKENQPKVEFVESYVESRGSKTLREVSKLFGIPERKFNNWLVDNKILYQQVKGAKLPYSNLVTNGYFRIKTRTYNGIVANQTKVTPRGVEWISRKLNRSNDFSK